MSDARIAPTTPAGLEDAPRTERHSQEDFPFVGENCGEAVPASTRKCGRVGGGSVLVAVATGPVDGGVVPVPVGGGDDFVAASTAPASEQPETRAWLQRVSSQASLVHGSPSSQSLLLAQHPATASWAQR